MLNDKAVLYFRVPLLRIPTLQRWANKLNYRIQLSNFPRRNTGLRHDLYAMAYLALSGGQNELNIVLNNQGELLPDILENLESDRKAILIDISEIHNLEPILKLSGFSTQVPLEELRTHRAPTPNRVRSSLAQRVARLKGV